MLLVKSGTLKKNLTGLFIKRTKTKYIPIYQSKSSIGELERNWVEQMSN